MATEIDPVEFGRMQGELHSLKGLVEDQGKKIDQILEIINKSKGGLWVVAMASSGIGGALSLFLQWMWGPHK